MNTIDDLKILQSLPLDVKIMKSKQRIKEWYNYWNGNVYVSISGGKDSQVLAHLVKSVYPDVPLVFVNTGLEYKGVREKGKELADYVLLPSLDFVNVIKNYGYPIISKEVALYVNQLQQPHTEKNDKTYNLRMYGIRSDGVKVATGKLPECYKFLIDAPFKISNQCCDIMKKKPLHKFDAIYDVKPIIGTMAVESRQRQKMWCQTGCNAFEKNKPSSTPIAFWTEQDIYQYIINNNLKIAPEYGDIVKKDEIYTLTGVKRTGCVFCMFGITNDTERFLKLKNDDIQLYNYVMNGGKFDDNGKWVPYNGLGYKFVIDWLNEYGNLNIKY